MKNKMYLFVFLIISVFIIGIVITKTSKSTIFCESIEKTIADSVFVLKNKISLNQATKDSYFSDQAVVYVNEEWNSIFIASFGYSIKQFDLNGSFIRSIGAEGEGPGEYKLIQSIFKLGNNMAFYDKTLNKILLYNKNGEFVKYFKTRHSDIRNFVQNGKEVFYFKPFNSGNKYTVEKTDTTFLSSTDLIKGPDQYYGFADYHFVDGGIVFNGTKLYEINSLSGNILNSYDIISNKYEKIQLPSSDLYYLPQEYKDYKFTNADNFFKTIDFMPMIPQLYMVEGQYLIIQYQSTKNDLKISRYGIYDLINKKAYSTKVIPFRCQSGNKFYSLEFSFNISNMKLNVSKVTLNIYQFNNKAL